MTVSTLRYVLIHNSNKPFREDVDAPQTFEKTTGGKKEASAYHLWIKKGKTPPCQGSAKDALKTAEPQP